MRTWTLEEAYERFTTPVELGGGVVVLPSQRAAWEARHPEVAVPWEDYGTTPPVVCPAPRPHRVTKDWRA